MTAKIIQFPIMHKCKVCGRRADYHVDYVDLLWRIKEGWLCNDAPWCTAVAYLDKQKKK